MTQQYGDDFVSSYMRLCNLEHSEAPAIYHRWTCMSILGAYMARNIWINFGVGPIYPNQYIMLMGSPGTRKGSAMSIGKAVLKHAGFNRFSASKTSKERFIMDLKQYDINPTDGIADLEEFVADAPAESYVYATEFTDFIGQGNMDFVTLLTNLWDNLDEYKHPKIQGKSVIAHKPTINMLGANTPEGFALAFPPEALGNGFLSRVILLHADVTGKRIAWPEPLDELQVVSLAQRLKEAREEVAGEIVVSKEAKEFGKEIYANEVPVEDPRFSHYQQRRYIHLLKMSCLLAAVDFSKTIKEIHIKRANTMLAAAEQHMGKALGEFGASKNSVIAGKILSYLATCKLPQSPTDLFKIVSRDISKMTDLAEVLTNLKSSERVQTVQIKGKSGYMPLHKPKKEWAEHLIDKSWLTFDELF